MDYKSFRIYLTRWR